MENRKTNIFSFISSDSIHHRRGYTLPENCAARTQILQLQMNEHQYHYLYATFDIDAFDLDDFKYNFVNITAFRLVDIDDIGVREILKDIRRYQQQQLEQHQPEPQQHEQQQQQPQVPPSKSNESKRQLLSTVSDKENEQIHQHQPQQHSDENLQSKAPFNGNKFIKVVFIFIHPFCPRKTL